MAILFFRILELFTNIIHYKSHIFKYNLVLATQEPNFLCDVNVLAVWFSKLFLDLSVCSHQSTRKLFISGKNCTARKKIYNKEMTQTKTNVNQ